MSELSSVLARTACSTAAAAVDGMVTEESETLRQMLADPTQRPREFDAEQAQERLRWLRDDAIKCEAQI